MTTYHALPTIALDNQIDYFRAANLPEIIHFDDPALCVMIDFTKEKTLTINQDASIVDAATEMRVCDVHMLIVTDKENNVVGLISSEDILGSKPLQFIQKNKVLRKNIKVRSLMLPNSKIIAINKQDLIVAKVGHVITTLHQAKQHYAFVIETKTNHHCTVVGIFSLSLISRQLDRNVTDYDLIAHSLAELHDKM